MADKNQLWALRHTAEHILMQAMDRLWPGKVIKAMGPATDDGFYFDFDPSPPAGGSGQAPLKISEADFPKMEKEMQKIIAADLPIVKKEVSAEEAKKLFKGNLYKMEWLDEIEKRGEKATIYYTGEKFVDLCAGPHAESTGKVKAFKLLSVAGAYWHGDEKNKMLTRIYGTAFPAKKELDEYLHLIEEVKKRDHRRLGKDLDLYSINPLTGPGLILWHPKLAASRNAMEQFWREEHIKRNYKLVYTPHIASMDMFVKTRHYTKYINSMFPVMLHQNIEGESKSDYTADEQLKPMNCPNHVQIFKAHPRSYRELPLRIGELGTVYRYEMAGVLHGLTRVRGFTQDDSHIFCTPEQVIDEVREVIKLTRYFYEDIFGFNEYQAYLSTRPEKYLGTVKVWEEAQNLLKEAMELEHIAYKIDEGAGVFYGPKIDSKVKDSLNREWQLGTIQFDFNLPTYSESSEKDIDDFWALKTFKDKFKTRENLAKYIKQMGRGLDAKYIDKDGKVKPTVMIHRVVLGSLERFYGILIEHFAGAFPVWLSPVQVVVLPITDKQIEYARKVYQTLFDEEIRVELDDSNNTLSYRIRNAELQKAPYILVVGEKEAQSGMVMVRKRGQKEQKLMKVEEFVKAVREKIEKRSLEI